MPSSFNIFANPIVVKSARERLRPRNALSWGLVIVIVTGFVYGICYQAAANYVQMRAEMAAKFALATILVMQGIILMLMGTGSVAIGIAQERMNGMLDYQRMTPMTPTSKILGYLIGLPIREYFLFLLTMPFVIYAAARSGIAATTLLHMYAVGFVSVWLYHMTGLVAGMVSPKPWRAGVATQGMVLLMYFVMPGLATLGFTFFLYLTPRPVFARLAFQELDLELRTIVEPSDLQESVPFFNLLINPSLFTVLLQGFLLVTLFTIVYRKWKEETQHPLSKGYALLVFLLTQVMLLGSLWAWLTHTGKFDDLEATIRTFQLFDYREVGVRGAVIGLVLYVFFFVSLAMALLMVSLITPTRYTFAKGLRRTRKLGLPRVPRLSDPATAMPYSILFVALTCISYAVLIWLAVDAGGYFNTPPSTFTLLLPAIIFAALVIYMQALCERFGLKGMLMAMFLIWMVPFLSFLFIKAAKGPDLVADYVGAPMPLNALYYAIHNLFSRDEWVRMEGLKLTIFAVVLYLGLATVAVTMMLKQQSEIRQGESEDAAGVAPPAGSAAPALASLSQDEPRS